LDIIGFVHCIIRNSLGSSSSGRMSTVSGCSGASGDSGTHSDSEDRRVCAILQISPAK